MESFTTGCNIVPFLPGAISIVLALALGANSEPQETGRQAQTPSGQETHEPPASATTPMPPAALDIDSEKLKAVVIRAFESTHQGYSSDEVLLDDELNTTFIKACRESLPDIDAFHFNWTLLNLRKAGKLSGIETTRRRRSDTESVLPVAEIAARTMVDKTDKSIDAILCDPTLRQEFDAVVEKIDPDADRYLARKAAFRLRKSRRLRPELITRIADWGRTIEEFTVAEIRSDWARVPELPGIYIFRDRSGYLYIGQSDNLRERMKSHLDQSSSRGLSRYLSEQPTEQIFVELHWFPADSRAKETMIRRAYESELIRTRKPRFNIQP